MRQYRTDGSAAVDVYAARESTARSLSKKPKRLPDVPAREKPAQRPRAAISLTAVVGAAAALFLLFLVVFSYVRLYELKSEVGELKQTVVKLNGQSDALRSEYEAGLDLQQVERRARELGLHEASPLQKIYVEVAPADTTEVYTPPAERNVFERVYDAFRYVLSDLKAYFS